MPPLRLRLIPLLNKLLLVCFEPKTGRNDYLFYGNQFNDFCHGGSTYIVRSDSLEGKQWDHMRFPS